MRARKLNFDELVNQNKQDLLNDEIAMKKLEESLDKKQASSSLKQKESDQIDHTIIPVK
ncbi:FbpB family small basic protein [Paraliobacillus sediminis]|uniref:FbpB family small basic protein n=1 Tax=Paraliobacillus sediminis TaxID=1885916 RepID=UPI001F07EBEC|nr:FbpB family small basic protein [Paraliobacillus sediminis]